MSDNNCFAAKRGVARSSPKPGGITAKHSRTLSANSTDVRKPQHYMLYDFDSNTPTPYGFTGRAGWATIFWQTMPKKF